MSPALDCGKIMGQIRAYERGAAAGELDIVKQKLRLAEERTGCGGKRRESE